MMGDPGTGYDPYGGSSPPAAWTSKRARKAKRGAAVLSQGTKKAKADGKLLFEGPRRRVPLRAAVVLAECTADNVVLLGRIHKGVMTCEDVPAYLQKHSKDAKHRGKSRLEIVYDMCEGRTYKTACCDFCTQYGYTTTQDNRDMPIMKQRISDMFPVDTTGFGVLVWPKFKHYCTVPPADADCARELDIAIDTTTQMHSLVAGQTVTAVRVVLDRLENIYQGIDSVQLSGTTPLQCHDDEVNGHWQEPLCKWCKVSDTEVWKGASCTAQTCDGVEGSCVFGFCDVNERCQCFRGYAGPTCSVQCPLNATSYYHLGDEHNNALPVNETGVSTRPDLLGAINQWTICGGNGYCNDGISGDGTCRCRGGFAGVNCTIRCPGLEHSTHPDTFVPCSGHGKCYDGAGGNATCQCHALYFGEDCSQSLCSGRECYHGVCLDPATEALCPPSRDGCYCACHGKESYSEAAVYKADSAGSKGYWEGTQCNICQDSYLMPDCKRRARKTKSYVGIFEADTEGTFTIHGPMFLEPCSELDIELILVSGDIAFAEIMEPGAYSVCMMQATAEQPLAMCTPDEWVIQSSQKTLYIRTESYTPTKTRYKVRITYEPRCTVDCGEHGLCSSASENFKLQNPNLQFGDDFNFNNFFGPGMGGDMGGYGDYDYAPGMGPDLGGDYMDDTYMFKNKQSSAKGTQQRAAKHQEAQKRRLEAQRKREHYQKQRDKILGRDAHVASDGDAPLQTGRKLLAIDVVSTWDEQESIDLAAFTEGTTISCTSGKAMTGLYGGIDLDITGLSFLDCATPLESTGYGSCTSISAFSAMGGWAECASDAFITGMTRSSDASCLSPDCIVSFECCTFTYDVSSAQSSVTSSDWSGCFNDMDSSQCEIGNSHFIQGLYSEGWSGIDGITSARGTQLLYESSAAPPTPSPPTPSPPTPSPGVVPSPPPADTFSPDSGYTTAPNVAPPTPSPPTPSPPTQSPPTPSPPTPSPGAVPSPPPADTFSPDSGYTTAPNVAPPTPSPPTPSPPTQSPPTPSPLAPPPTPAPPTPSPPTPSPPTPAPDTSVPSSADTVSVYANFESIDLSTQFTAGATVSCSPGMAMTGLYGGGCLDITCLQSMDCSPPSESTGYGSCTSISAFSAMGGWAECSSDAFITGMTRSSDASCLSPDCIVSFECCTFTYDVSSAQSSVISSDWSGCFNTMGSALCEIGNSHFIQGLYSEGWSGIDGIASARGTQLLYESSSVAAPPTPSPPTSPPTPLPGVVPSPPPADTFSPDVVPPPTPAQETGYPLSTPEPPTPSPPTSPPTPSPGAVPSPPPVDSFSPDSGYTAEPYAMHTPVPDTDEPIFGPEVPPLGEVGCGVQVPFGGYCSHDTFDDRGVCQCYPGQVCKSYACVTEVHTCNYALYWGETCHSSMVELNGMCHCVDPKTCSPHMTCVTTCHGAADASPVCEGPSKLVGSRCICNDDFVCDPSLGICVPSEVTCNPMSPMLGTSIGQSCSGGAEANVASSTCVCRSGELCDSSSCVTKCNHVSQGRDCGARTDAALFPLCACTPGASCSSHSGLCGKEVLCDEPFVSPADTCHRDTMLVGGLCVCYVGTCTGGTCVVPEEKVCSEAVTGAQVCDSNSRPVDGVCECYEGTHCANYECLTNCNTYPDRYLMCANGASNAYEAPYHCVCSNADSCDEDSGKCLDAVTYECGAALQNTTWQVCASFLTEDAGTCSCTAGNTCSYYKSCGLACDSAMSSGYVFSNCLEGASFRQDTQQCACDEGTCYDGLCWGVAKCGSSLKSAWERHTMRCDTDSTLTNNVCVCNTGTCTDLGCRIACNTATHDIVACVAGAAAKDGLCACDSGSKCMEGACYTASVESCNTAIDAATQSCASDAGLLLNESSSVCYCAGDNTCVDGTCYIPCGMTGAGTCVPSTEDRWGDDETCTCSTGYTCAEGLCLEVRACGNRVVVPATQVCATATTNVQGVCTCLTGTVCNEDATCVSPCETNVTTATCAGYSYKNTDFERCHCTSGTHCATSTLCALDIVTKCGIAIDTTSQQCASTLTLSASSCICSDETQRCASGYCVTKCPTQACESGFVCHESSGECVVIAVTTCETRLDVTLQKCGGGLEVQSGKCQCKSDAQRTTCVAGTCHTPCECTHDLCPVQLLPCAPGARGIGCSCDAGLICHFGACSDPYAPLPNSPAPPTDAPPTLAPPPPTPMPPPCADDPEGWLMTHTGLLCAQIVAGRRGDVCNMDLREIFTDMPSESYRLKGVCKSTCNCCGCDEPPFYDSCGAVLQVNHSCVLNATGVTYTNNASNASDSTTCECSGDTQCVRGKCRTFCDAMRTAYDPPCVSYTEDAHVVGTCTCDAGQNYQCSNGTCTGGVAGCGMPVGGLGCTEGSVDIHGLCTCEPGMLCDKGKCSTRCNVQRNNATMPPCTARTISRELLYGTCLCVSGTVCSSAGTCTVGLVPARDSPAVYGSSPGCDVSSPPTYAPSCNDCDFFWIPSRSECRACSIHRAVLTATTARMDEPDAVWCGTRCLAPELLTVSIYEGPFVLPELTAASHNVRMGETYHQMFSPNDNGCLSRVKLLVAHNCPGTTSTKRSVRPDDVCTSCSTGTALVLREGSCSGDIISVGSPRGPLMNHVDGFRWVDYTFKMFPYLYSNVTYCASLEVHTTCAGHLLWAVQLGEVGGALGGAAGEVVKSPYGDSFVVANYSHAMAVVVHPNVMEGVPANLTCHRGQTCEPGVGRKGFVVHGIARDAKECTDMALRVQARFMIYHTSTRNCTSYMTCSRAKESVGYHGTLDVNGPPLLCELPEPAACSVAGRCVGHEYGDKWSTRCEKHCRLCRMEDGVTATGMCYACRPGYALHIHNQVACTGVCKRQVAGETLVGATCKPQCTCEGEVGYGWCGGYPAGLTHCRSSTKVDGMCTCAKGLWCDNRGSTEGDCLDGTDLTIPTGWCDQLSRNGKCSVHASEACKDGTCLCTCDNGYNCDKNDGTCVSQTIQCGYSSGEYGFCAAPARPHPDTRKCTCPKGYQCKLDSVQNINMCVVRSCGTCGELPCENIDQVARHNERFLRRQVVVQRRSARVQQEFYDPGMYDPGMYAPGMYDPYDPGMGGGYTPPDPFKNGMGTYAPFSLDLPDKEHHKTYAETYLTVSDKYCLGPHSVLRYDFAGTGQCLCRKDRGYQCCDPSSAGSLSKCSNATYGSCIFTMEDKRSKCGEKPSDYGCRENATVVWEGTGNERDRVCRCDPGFLCNQLYQVCERFSRTMTKMIVPAQCDRQDVGGGCGYKAFPDSAGVCRCSQAYDDWDTENNYYCQATGRCRRKRDSTCKTQKEALDNYGECLCDSDLRNGYWNGTQCEACVDGWFGSACALTCNLTLLSEELPELAGLPSYLHGTYQRPTEDLPDGFCKCPTEEGGYPLGFTGQLCSDCLASDGRFGDNCSQSEPTTLMIWDMELPQYEEYLLGPFAVLSYSMFSTAIDIIGGDVTQLVELTLKVMPTYREGTEIFDPELVAAESDAGAEPSMDPMMMMMGFGGFDFGPTNQGVMTDPSENDTNINCLEDPQWPATGSTGSCSTAIPRGMSYAVVKVVSAFPVEVSIKTRLVGSCCHGHGYCGADPNTCECANSELLGYWSTADKCASCDKGYSGLRCTQFSSTLTQKMTSLPGSTLPAPVLGSSTYYSVEVTDVTPFTAKLTGRGDCDLAATLTKTCEEGWVSYKGDCYQIGTTCNSTFEQADAACKAEGGSLLEVKNEDAFFWFLRNLLESTRGEAMRATCTNTFQGIWTDLHRKKETNCSNFALREICVASKFCTWATDTTTLTSGCVLDPTLSCTVDPEGYDMTPQYNRHTEESCNQVGHVSLGRDGKNRSTHCAWNSLVRARNVTVKVCDGTTCVFEERDFGTGACEPQWAFHDVQSNAEHAAVIAAHLNLMQLAHYDACVDETFLSGGTFCEQSRTLPSVWDTMGNEMPIEGTWEQGASCRTEEAHPRDTYDCGGAQADDSYKALLCGTRPINPNECFQGHDNQAMREAPGYPWDPFPEVMECEMCSQISSVHSALRDYELSQFAYSSNETIAGCFILMMDLSTTGSLSGVPAYCFNPYTQEEPDLKFDENRKKQERALDIFEAGYICQKPRTTIVSPSDGLVIQETASQEDLLAKPTCYNPVAYPDTTDICSGVIPRGLSFIALRVTCLQPDSAYNLSLTYVAKGHYVKGDTQPCVNDRVEGHWMGTFCSECMPRWSGGNCLTFTACKMEGECVHGTCGADGFCSCEAGYYGNTCDTPCDADTCLNGGLCNTEYQLCDSTGGVPQSCESWEQNKICSCVGGFGGEFCGQCGEGLWGASCTKECLCSSQPCHEETGECQCWQSDLLGFYTGETCSECEEDYFGSDCITYCNPDLTCTGHGTCTQSGTCQCEDGYYDFSCSTSCTPDICTNHGTCDQTSGACICHDTYSDGFWHGKTCSTCKPGYYGAECKQDCQCAMHGTCDTVNGKCYCYDDELLGHWTGKSCTACKIGYTGSECKESSTQSKNAIARVSKLFVDGSDRSTKTYLRVSGAAVLFDTDDTQYLLSGAGGDIALFTKPLMDPKITEWSYVGRCSLQQKLGYGEDIVLGVKYKNHIYVGLRGSESSAITRFTTVAPLDIQEGLASQCPNINSTSVLTTLAAGEGITSTELLAMTLDSTYGSIYAATKVTTDGTVAFVLARLPLDMEGLEEFLEGANHRLSTQIELPSFSSVTGLVLNKRDSHSNKLLANPHLFVLGLDTKGLTLMQKVYIPTTTLNSAGGLGAVSSLRPVYSFSPAFCAAVPCENIMQGAILRGWLYLTVETYNSRTAERSAVLGRINLDNVKEVAGSSHIVIPETWTGSETGIGFMTIDADESLKRSDIKIIDPFPHVAEPTSYLPCNGKACGDTCLSCNISTKLCVESTEIKYCTTRATCEPGRPLSCSLAQNTYVYIAMRNSTPSVIYKYKIDELKGTFSKELPSISFNFENTASQYQVAVASIIDPKLRLMYVATKLNRFQISVLNLFDVVKLSPVYVDGTGGTLVTVKGTGFPTGLNASDTKLVAACKWGEAKYVGSAMNPTATIIDSQTVICKAPRKQGFDACEDVPLEVSVENGERFSSNGVFVRHINKPIVFSVKPLRATLHSETPITISGTGFFDSPYIACKINNEITEATWKTSITIWCTHPKTNTPSVTTVEITLDGQQFSSSNVPYLIVGTPTKIEWILNGDTTLGKSVAYSFDSAVKNEIPRLDVIFKDAAGNEVGNRDELIRKYNVSVHMVSPHAPRIAPCESGPCGGLNGLIYTPVAAGRAVLEGLYTEHPGVGFYKMYIDLISPEAVDCRPVPGAGPQGGCLGLVEKTIGGNPEPVPPGVVTFEVTAKATLVEFVVEPPMYSTNKEKLAVQPKLVFKDISNNVVATHTGKVNLLLRPENGVQDAARLEGAAGDRNTVEYKDGFITFFRLRILDGVEGRKYTILFIPDTPGIQQVSSKPLYIAKCAAGSNAISGIFPDNGLLGAQLVTVKGWGYREENANSLFCKFGEDSQIAATFVDTCTLLCPLQAKVGPRSARLRIATDASGVWYDNGFNYSYIDVLDDITWEVTDNKRRYPSNDIVKLNTVTITLRDMFGSWIRHWDTEGRKIYVKSRMGLQNNDASLPVLLKADGEKLIYGVVENGQVNFTSLVTHVPIEGAYTLLFTTDPNAPLPAPLFEDKEKVDFSVTQEQVVVQELHHEAYELYPKKALTGKLVHLRPSSLRGIALPPGVVVDMSSSTIQLSSQGANPITGLRMMDLQECAEICDQLTTCIGFGVHTLLHTCQFVAQIDGDVEFALGVAAVSYEQRNATEFTYKDIDSCADRNCSLPDEAGEYACLYEVPRRQFWSALQYLDTHIGISFDTALGVDATPAGDADVNVTLTATEFAAGVEQTIVNVLNETFNATIDPIITPTIVNTAVEGNETYTPFQLAFLQKALALFKLNNPPGDACVQPITQCMERHPAKPHPEFFFATTTLITIGEGKPHHLSFIGEYSRGTTNRRQLDVQPTVLIVDVADNEVQTFAGAPLVRAVVRPYCVRSLFQTLDDFRYPHRAPDQSRAGCLEFIPNSVLEQGVENYGRRYGPTCHGTAPAGKAAEFERTCTRLRGDAAWIVNARARFTELHFRGCASDLGLACNADVQYKIHFSLEGAGVEVPVLSTLPIYTINCPKSNAALSGLIPKWAKLSAGAVVTMKGWDFQPTRKLSVKLAGVKLVPVFLDTCTSFVRIPGAAGASIEEAVFDRDASVLETDRDAETQSLFGDPAAATFEVTDEDNPDFTSPPLAFQIKSSLATKVGVASEPEFNETLPMDNVPCTGDADSGVEPTFPRRCFVTDAEVNVGEIHIILKDAADGDLYAVGTHEAGTNYGFYETVTNPLDPKGPKVWGREYPGSVSQAIDVQIDVEVYNPVEGGKSQQHKINQADSRVNISSGGSSRTHQGLYVLSDAMLFYPKFGEYIFRFKPSGRNARGKEHQEGGLRINIVKGRARTFAFSEEATLSTQSDGKVPLQPTPRLSLFDVSGNSLSNSDLPSSDTSLEVKAFIVPTRVLKHPPLDWVGWNAGDGLDEIDIKDRVLGDYYMLLDDIQENMKWKTKVDKTGTLHPLGSKEDPEYSFYPTELGGETFEEPVSIAVLTATGEVRMVSSYHSGASLTHGSAPVALGVEFKDQKVLGLFHGVMYNITYTLSLDHYKALGTLNHTMVASTCSDTQFAVNFSSICTECPAGAKCYRDQFLRALPDYWRYDQQDVVFYECPVKGACKGGYWAGDRSCQEGSEGILCAVCSDGYGKNTNDMCEKCPGIVLNIFMVLFIVVMLVVCNSPRLSTLFSPNTQHSQHSFSSTSWSSQTSQAPRKESRFSQSS